MNTVELISGKAALIAWTNKIPVEYTSDALGEWFDVYNGNTLGIFERSDFKFRLKPRTITINGIEVPAPFEPKDGDKYYHISIQTSIGYGWYEWESSDYDARASIFGAWRTEEEIKQVVSALRTVLGAQS